MEVVKLRRCDEPMFYHTFCPNCHRWLSGTEVGCFYCCECGTSLDWGEKQRNRFINDSSAYALYIPDKQMEMKIESFEGRK